MFGGAWGLGGVWGYFVACYGFRFGAIRSHFEAIRSYQGMMPGLSGDHIGIIWCKVFVGVVSEGFC